MAGIKAHVREMDFPMALEALYQGEAVIRQAWGMNASHIWYVRPTIWTFVEGEMITGIKTEWNPTQEDLLADDWKFVT